MLRGRRSLRGRARSACLYHEHADVGAAGREVKCEALELGPLMRVL